jgi:hypothetical protein
MRRCVTSLIAVLLMATFVAAWPQQPVTDRIIEEDLRLRPPLVPCAVPAYAALVVRSARVPAGIEAVAERCSVGTRTPSNAANDVFLQGVSVREAFDKLVQLDPRYSWTESDGVLVMRPVLASHDPSHFLHQTITFNLNDGRLSGALYEIKSALSPFPFLGGDQFGFSTPEGNRRFSVSLNATSVLEALNTSVRTHWSMWWEVTYCQPLARYEYATVGFKTFDGSGLSSHVSTRGDDGKMFDACLPRNLR